MNELKNWQKSPYPFKSPHRKSKYRTEIFNYLNKKAGDPRRFDQDRVSKNSKRNLEITDEIIERLNNFSKLTDYTSLSKIEQVIPLRDVVVIPAKQGIVIYSAYSMLLSNEKNKPASYEAVHKYLNIKYRQENQYEGYIITNLVRDYFKLYTLAKPFRVLLGLRIKGRFHRSTHKNFEKSQNYLKNNIEIMEEWERISRPSLILTSVYDIVNEHGYQMGLQFVRYLFRASSKIREILNTKKPKKIDIEKIRSLTERYLSINALKERYQDFPPPLIQRKGISNSKECPSCGEKIASDANFCSNCGEKF